MTAASTMLSPSAAEQAVFFATHEIEPNDERLLLRYKTELDAVPLYSQTPEPNLKLYFFMHSALLLWLRVCQRWDRRL